MSDSLLDIERWLKKDSAYIVGRVHSVKGREVRVEVYKNKNHPYFTYDGQLVKGVAVASYVKILKGLTTIIGKIEGEYIEEEKITSQGYSRAEDRVRRYLEVSLFGHYDNGRFYQGVKELPLIDNECFVLEPEEFDRLHSFHEEDDTAVAIGLLTEEPTHSIRAGLDKLFASHIGIFGNTGSGKSNTLARIYTELFSETLGYEGFREKSKFVVIDFNGEYVGDEVLTAGDNKRTIELSTHKRLENISDGEKYPVSEKVFEDPEILSVILHATDKTQKPFLTDALRSDYLKDRRNLMPSVAVTIRKMLARNQLTAGKDKILELLESLKEFVEQVDALGDLIERLETNLGQNSAGSFLWPPATSPYQHDIFNLEIKPSLDSISLRSTLSSLDVLKLRVILHYYFKVATARINPEHVAPVVGRMRSGFETVQKVLRLDNTPLEQNIIVVSLRNVRLEMKKILPLVISRHLYEEQKDKNSGKPRPSSSLHIIIDEAHNILSEQSQRESESWKDYRLETFEEIIKEGRKFGVFITLASQRPADISHTIISQLHNYFIHRLMNTADIGAIQKAVAYLDKLSFETLPILPVGTCFFAGLATDMPVKIDIVLLEDARRPRSETVKLTEIWNEA